MAAATTLEGSTMPPEPATVRLAVASGTNADDVARITAVPAPTLVTGITSVVKPGAAANDSKPPAKVRAG